MRLAHIINPVKVKASHELAIAQPITFESMRRAKRKYVDIFAVGYPEDGPIIPKDFVKCGSLDKSIADYHQFRVYRKLPLFRHILDRLYESSDAEYFIQTNVDIGLMPHFYESIHHFIDMGYDAMVINKRLISRHYTKIEELPEMYCDLGLDHNGCDCFVFRRDAYPKYDLGNICMGTPWSETTLVANMIMNSKRFLFLRRPHLTFHIGDSRTWLHKDLADYRQFNTEEFARILTKLIKLDKAILGNDTIKWFVQKMKGELQPHYSQECHDLCKQVALLF